MKTSINDYLKMILDILIIFITLTKSKIKDFSIPIKISFNNKKNKKCFLLGNGPSLNTDIDKIINLTDPSTDIYAVNYFGRSQFFKKLKPNYYFFSDKMFWSKDLIEKVKKDNEDIFNILRNVNWKITIICPKEGYDFIKNQIFENKNLSFYVVPIRYSNLLTEKLTYLSIKNRFFSIPNVNSVITLLWMSIFSRYKKITLYGCDFSAFKTLMVDQKTNEIIVSTKHFYGNSSAEKNAGKKYLGQKDKPLSVRLFQVHRAFRQLDILAKVSRELSVEVINGSSFSFIDSFPRANQVSKK
tara:strand:+ start:13830 stop:14726 length:897 start_codon:yes stop_codon:yes gene_type:complete